MRYLGIGGGSDGGGDPLSGATGAGGTSAPGVGTAAAAFGGIVRVTSSKRTCASARAQSPTRPLANFLSTTFEHHLFADVA